MPGFSAGAEGLTVGEVVFNTSLTGYQEIFTDPSYHGQMVVMTNPLIGNYGVNRDDEESRQPFARGVIVREMSRRPSNFRAQQPLDQFLKESGVVGIEGVDTRCVTKLLRVKGSLKGVIAAGGESGAAGTEGLSDDDLVDRARAWEGLSGRDMVAEVTCSRPEVWSAGLDSPIYNCFRTHGPDVRPGAGLRIAALDYGVKYNILRILTSLGFEVHRLPASTTADEVRALKPDGVFLSNGPGDPEGVPYAVKTIRELLGELPIFGICLGHQLTALALGARTYKLPFGHHGGNHPVKNLLTDKVEISVQNHCYAVDTDSLGQDIRPFFVNLNDQSLEGLVHTELPVFTVQFHPESAPGPNDFTFLFDRFVELVREKRPLHC